MSPIALYYPWMHFQNEQWLKLAILSWERIARVRPPEVEDFDGDLVRHLRQESDFLLDVTPSREDLDCVGEIFLRAIDDAGVNREAYATSRARLPAPGGQSLPISLGPPGADRRLQWVYSGGNISKMSYVVANELKRAGLAARRPGDAWIGMHPELASVYLAALADAMAQSNALTPVTDDPNVHHATGALDRLPELFGRDQRPTGASTESAYVYLALAAAITPRNIADVPVSRLVRFRQRHGAELAAFREHIDSLAAEFEGIAKVESPQLARAHLESLYARTTKRRLDELRRALRALGVDTSVGGLELKVDLGAASGTALGAVAAAGGHLALAGAAVSVSIVPYIVRAVTARQRTRAESSVAYLLAAGRELGGRAIPIVGR